MSSDSVAVGHHHVRRDGAALVIDVLVVRGVAIAAPEPGADLSGACEGLAEGGEGGTIEGYA